MRLGKLKQSNKCLLCKKTIHSPKKMNTNIEIGVNVLEIVGQLFFIIRKILFKKIQN